LKILKLNSNSTSSEFVPKRFFQLVLSFYSIGISKNLWKNYSIKIGNGNKNKYTNVVFYKKSFSYPIIKIKYSKINNQDYIEIENNHQKINFSDINLINYWFKNYFLDKAKI
tara:strand:+ start:209 stop:544 length:336 start_codon:yes stop_codon:yes gene_type:complete